MKILYSNNDLNEALKDVTKLGFVPTMGSLHKGHLSLIRRSKKECVKTIVSIFINPTQFNNKNDFRNYPRNLKNDLLILKKSKVDFVYIPSKKHVYNSKKNSKIKLNIRDKILCAKFRKGHFEGVIDVMDRLTNLIRPKKIFMGEKDFQQLYLVKKYIETKYKCLVLSCATVRDKNSIALSSRNLLLTKKNLIVAGKLAKDLISFKKILIKKKSDVSKMINVKKKNLTSIYNLHIEYLELRSIFNLNKSNTMKNSKIFVAYYLDKIRMIDNF